MTAPTSGSRDCIALLSSQFQIGTRRALIEAVNAPHVPVLKREILEALACPEAGWFLDGTLGAGGHTRALLEAVPQARVLGLDRDPQALALAQERLSEFGDRVLYRHAAFVDAPQAAEDAGAGPFQGIVLDLGMSSMQVDQAERGFSFQGKGPLDMRMDPTQSLTAAQLVNELPEEELAEILRDLGEERFWRRIARAIVTARRISPLESTDELAAVVSQAVPNPHYRAPRGRGRRPAPRLHPATRTFQALRLAVNDELGQVERGLPALWNLLSPGGRLAVISFHSLEDRLAKQFLKGLKREKLAELLSKKPLRAREDEVQVNPRARSAKLRVGVRLDAAPGPV